MLTPSMRWFGPEDRVSIKHIVQGGSQGIVTALHGKKPGELWTPEEIQDRITYIEDRGSKWVVVESIPVHNDIKLGTGDRDKYIETFIQTAKNLAEKGVHTTCYNFMPLLDWTRSNLAYALPNGATVLAFNPSAAAAFDKYVLERTDFESSYREDALGQADTFYHQYMRSDSEFTGKLTNALLGGLPGSAEEYNPKTFLTAAEPYYELGREGLQKNLLYFLNALTGELGEVDMNFAIHPDDPPWEIFGLSRVVSTKDDFAYLFRECDSTQNGLTLCTGSLGLLGTDHVSQILTDHKDRIYFVHLRNVSGFMDFERGFMETGNHLEGRVGMHDVVHQLEAIQPRVIPYRPDHGPAMFGDELETGAKPGYTLHGRVLGLTAIETLRKHAYNEHL